MSILLQYGASFDIRNKRGRSALDHCSIEKKAILGIALNQLWCETPLHRASYLNDIEGVRILLESHEIEDLNVKDSRGWTALHIACYLGHTETVVYLLGGGSAGWGGNGNNEESVVSIGRTSDPRIATGDTRLTALHIACSRGYCEIQEHICGSLKKWAIFSILHCDARRTEFEG